MILERNSWFENKEDYNVEKLKKHESKISPKMDKWSIVITLFFELRHRS